MDMYEYFEGLINEAIQNDKDMHKEYEIWSEPYGWNIRNKDTDEEIDIIIEIR